MTEDLEEWIKSVIHIDSTCHVMLTNESSRKSSVSQGKMCRSSLQCTNLTVIINELYPSILIPLGRGLLMVIQEVFPNDKYIYELLSSRLTRYDGLRSDQGTLSVCDDEGYRCHHAPLFGLICGILKLSLSTTRIMYMRSILRDVLSAACRLSALGPIESLRLQIYYSRYIQDQLLILDREANELVAVLMLPSLPNERLCPIHSCGILLCDSDHANSNTNIDLADNSLDSIYKKRKISSASDPATNTVASASSSSSSRIPIATTTSLSDRPHSLPSTSIDPCLYTLLSDKNKATWSRYHSTRDEKADIGFSRISTVAPVLELIQSKHEQLYSRLFMS